REDHAFAWTSRQIESDEITNHPLCRIGIRSAWSGDTFHRVDLLSPICKCGYGMSSSHNMTLVCAWEMRGDQRGWVDFHLAFLRRACQRYTFHSSHLGCRRYHPGHARIPGLT